MLRCTSVGGDHQDAPAVTDEHHRRGAALTGPRAAGRQQKQRPAVHYLRIPLAASAKLLDQLCIEVVLIVHNTSCLYISHCQCNGSRIVPSSRLWPPEYSLSPID